ncbi:MAG: UbiE/COQ5 methyltransferase family protein, partial [Rubritepida sp.]|nr:UbiE/COQ5 methyltransferase family protein [Rubritepida sp.]
QRASQDMYNTEAACAIYRNFLDWLFATFEADEATWRKAMAARLRVTPGQKVLVTGCGLGDDIPAILELVGPEGEVHAQDLSPAMTIEAASRWAQDRPEQARQISFSTGNALRLPFADHVFDAAFHFGGINLFDDVGQGMAEMNRVVRPGGRVVVSDEGVGPWLKDTDFGRMVVTNNRLWGLEAPIRKLPATAADVVLGWVLGNCFWVIEFTVSDATPRLNPHVPHKGRRGGTMWTRHRGLLEAVTPEMREKVERAAARAGTSVHDWLESALAKRLEQTQDGER